MFWNTWSRCLLASSSPLAPLIFLMAPSHHCPGSAPLFWSTRHRCLATSRILCQCWVTDWVLLVRGLCWGFCDVTTWWYSSHKLGKRIHIHFKSVHLSINNYELLLHFGESFKETSPKTVLILTLLLSEGQSLIKWILLQPRVLGLTCQFHGRLLISPPFPEPCGSL